MFHISIGPEFRAVVARLARPLAPVAERISRSVLPGARNVLFGGVAGWGAAIIAGAVLMVNAGHDGVAAPPAPALAAAPVAPPPPAPAAKVDLAEIAAQPAKPAPAPPPPVTAKSTQRVDMTPTAAIPAEPAHKPKPKPHKKKAKDVDIPN